MTKICNDATLDQSASYIEIDCEITGDDLNRMIYYFDSGMCDMTTKNAAALALNRKLDGKHSVRVSRQGRTGPCRCRIDGRDCQVSSGLEKFFDNVEQGRFMEGQKFRVKLPFGMVSEK